ncbi:MAG: DUF3987 domain-containing protein, partial [Candidatus Cloacimonetes bacterium]|nr:DUF3987 domain-containing protein [Candidatus Cloacimonadota bacterium]MDY0366764.1 DUF3987 domain-containing protein [Candidatus Syntrophosphaera sp.]
TMRRELIELFGKKPSVDLDLDKVPLLLRDYIKLTSKSTDCHPGLLISAWLPHIAVNLGNRVFMLSNSNRIYPNIWSCLLGPSSISRKTTAITYAGYTIRPHEELYEDMPLDVYEAETQLLSNVTYSKMLSMLSLNGTRLFIHHELSAWLAEMNKHFNSGYKQTITELYDGVSKTVSNQTKTERIRKPALSISTATTEAWMYRNIRENSDQLGGFLQRFIYFVVRDINLEDIDLDTKEGEDLEERLAIYEGMFKHFRAIPGSHRIRMSDEAVALRDSLYKAQYKTWFAKNNDDLMSYFTRIYDGYFYKFCAIFSLVEIWEELGEAIQRGCCERFFEGLRVSEETAAQCLYLCDFYFANTIPFLEIVSEQDKLSGERKLVELLVNKYNGKVSHTALMNMSHMKKREFKECIESLIEREAITVDTFQARNYHNTKYYILAEEILKSFQSTG